MCSNGLSLLGRKERGGRRKGEGKGKVEGASREQKVGEERKGEGRKERAISLIVSSCKSINSIRIRFSPHNLI